MIPVLRLVQSLRYALRDMQGAKVSDFELIESINQAASLLYSQMSERFVQFGIENAVKGSVGQEAHGKRNRGVASVETAHGHDVPRRRADSVRTRRGLLYQRVSVGGIP